MSETHPRGLLDTSVAIDIVRARDTIGLPDQVVISAITLAELSYGIAVATDPLEATRRAQRYARLSTWLQPLPFDTQAADIYGELVALVLANGRSPRPRRFDLLIAATAAAHALPLYTLNLADFTGLESRVDLIG
ncbi:MAG: PIN domain-containing protein [Propionibacteriaceae bacterium]|nr:PIN domain-containing protein [Propionibacteriaceae bacterium]